MSVDEKYLQTVMRTLSHDMGSSLRAASGFSKLITERYGDQLDEKALNWLSLIRSEGDIAQKKLRALSQYARLYGVDGLSDSCDLNQACQRAQEEPILKQKLSDHSATLTLSVATLPTITGSANMWQLYFSHILSNVVEHALADEPIECSIYVESNDRLNAETGIEQQVLVIEDSGKGLSIDNLIKALLPYRSLYVPQEGDDVADLSSGMGLALAKRIVEMHDGVFVVCARPDERPGLRVEARLPIA